MTEGSGWQALAVAAWVVVSGVVGYACLAYAVMQADGGEIRGLVNRIIGQDV